MEKDFSTWYSLKERIHSEERNKLYHERELWWCSLGTNIGFEQDGTGEGKQRPVLILKGISRETCYVIPLTTSIKRHRYRLPIGHVEGKKAVALMSQIRIIDTKRLVNKIGFLDQECFIRVRKTAKDLL
ncbi:MAG: PemK-like protein [Parcubacteria bacterium C7867-004]|nr:MAG: PemK-like protein [Parcubacteria bacterium C7867-004]